jgi:hypothetical protein
MRNPRKGPGGLVSELTGWNSLDITEPTAELWFSEDEAYRSCGALAAVMCEHPTVVRRRAHRDVEPVLRVSDCISDISLDYCRFGSANSATSVTSRSVSVPRSDKRHYDNWSARSPHAVGTW